MTPNGHHDSDDKLQIDGGVFNDDKGASSSDLGTQPALLVDRHGNGGYKVAFQPSLYNLDGLSDEELENEVIDSFCYWNSKTGINFEIVDDCIPLDFCAEIRSFNWAGGSGDAILASGQQQINNSTIDVCTGQPHVAQLTLTFHTDYIWLEREAMITDNDEKLMYQQAVHEIGHLIGLTHVRDKFTLMHPEEHNINVIGYQAHAVADHVTTVSSNTDCGGEGNIYDNQFLPDCITGIKKDVSYSNKCKVFPTLVSFQDVRIESMNAGTIIDAFSLLRQDGSLVFEKLYINNSISSFSTANLGSGIYFLKIKTNSSYEIHKIIIL